jgi:hypothetical protein
MLILGGLVYGIIYIVNSVNEGLSSTKESYADTVSFLIYSDHGFTVRQVEIQGTGHLIEWCISENVT